MQRQSQCVSVTPSLFSLLPSPSPIDATASHRSNQDPKKFSGCTFYCLFTDLVLICHCVFDEELGHCWMTSPLQLMLSVKYSRVIKFWLLLLPASTLHHPFINRSGFIPEVISICPTYSGGLSSLLLLTSSRCLVPMLFYFNGFNLWSLPQ